MNVFISLLVYFYLFLVLYYTEISAPTNKLFYVLISNSEANGMFA